MSAFMCSDRHLGILAAYAVAHLLDKVPYALRTELERDGFECKPGATHRTISRVASMLASENLRSLAHRYPRDHHLDAAAYDNFDIPRTIEADARMTPTLHIIKACHCYAYQACEHPGWQDSAARKLVDAIEAHAVLHLPGYDAAPWGL
jgi:hypothetical protein